MGIFKTYTNNNVTNNNNNYETSVKSGVKKLVFEENCVYQNVYFSFRDF